MCDRDIFLFITLATWAVTDNLWRISLHFQRVDAVMQGVIMAEDSPRILRTALLRRSLILSVVVSLKCSVDMTETDCVSNGGMESRGMSLSVIQIGFLMVGWKVEACCSA